ncbi:MAG: hypothetical protein ACO1OK_12880 [Devosia sp.]
MADFLQMQGVAKRPRKTKNALLTGGALDADHMPPRTLKVNMAGQVADPTPLLPKACDMAVP